MGQSRGNSELGPPSAYQRTVMIAAVTFTVLAAIIYVLVLLLGGGSSDIGRIFLPVAIAATGIGLVASIAAIVDERARTIGITTAIVLLPCAFLAALSFVALGS
jgi:hypothetical protein